MAAPQEQLLKSVRRDRDSHDDALLDVTLDRHDGRPDPEWVHLTRSYGERDGAASELSMTVQEFRWLIQDAGPKLLDHSREPAPDA